MATHITHPPEIPTSIEPHQGRWRRRLIWLLALLAASAASAVPGIAVAEQLTGSAPVAPAVHHEPNGNTPEGQASTPINGAPNAVTAETAGTTENRGSSNAGGQARPQPRQEYVWRPAYVRGKVVLIRIRADAANVREDRGISK